MPSSEKQENNLLCWHGVLARRILVNFLANSLSVYNWVSEWGGGGLAGRGGHMNGASQSRHPAGRGVVLENSLVHGIIEDLVDVP